MSELRIIVCEDIARTGEPVECGTCPECGSVVTTRQGIVFWCRGCRDHVPACSIVTEPSTASCPKRQEGP
jgi:hypothetical protein